MNTVLGLILLVIAVVVIGSISLAWRFSRSGSLLKQWAEQSGYRLIDQEYQMFFRGPFFMTTGKGQTVYYVTVEDSQGRRRKGWVRCGGWFLGLLSDNVEVSWDD